MKPNTLFFLTFIALILFACGKTGTDMSTFNYESDYSEAYRFFPLKKGNRWEYNYKYSDSSNNVLSNFDLNAHYSPDSGGIIYYYGNALYQAIYWRYKDEKLTCCNGKTLFRFDEINSNEDSFMISRDESNPNMVSTVYQYGKKQYLKDNMVYQNIPCIMIRDYTIFKNGRHRCISRYFGKNVGLIRDHSVVYDSLGKVSYSEVLNLKNHQF